MKFASINPATGETLQIFEEMSAEAASSAIEYSHQAFQSWKNLSFAERAVHMLKMSDLLLAKKTGLAQLMAREMGKPLAQGVAEAEKCASVCRYYAEQAEFFLTEDLIRTEATKSYVTFEPLGPVLAVMPWNFPLWQVFRFAAPTLMAGNTALLKHASNVSGCALEIEKLFVEAGFPKNVFSTLLISSSHVDSVVKHPLVKAVTLTGSTEAGRDVARSAGENLKKIVLELGGSDAYIVLADADIDAAVELCVKSRLINSGQSCIAAKRFVVVKEVIKPFTEKFVKLMQSKKMGSPLSDDTAVGPLARHDLQEQLHQQVLTSVKNGAVLALGGQIPVDNGAYYVPTVLTNVKPGMPAYDDELFGPVAAIIEASDEADAIRLANDSVFGLGSAIFSRDTARAEKLALQLESGCCFINAIVASDPRLPFGGIKTSGYGRELGSYGIKEFVNIKTIYVK